MCGWRVLCVVSGHLRVAKICLYGADDIRRGRVPHGWIPRRRAGAGSCCCSAAANQETSFGNALSSSAPPSRGRSSSLPGVGGSAKRPDGNPFIQWRGRSATGSWTPLFLFRSLFAFTSANADMSWRETEWQVGLGPEAMRNVAALEAKAAQARKECQQKQLQLDNATAAGQRAKQEGEAARREVQSLERDIQQLENQLQKETNLRTKTEQEAQVCGGVSCILFSDACLRA